MLKIRTFVLSFLVIGAIVLPQAARATDNKADPAAGFIQKLADSTLISLSSGKVPDAEKTERLRTLFREGFDLQTISRFVLGTHWRQASEGQRSEYQKLFENMIVQHYKERLNDNPVKSFKITNVKPAGQGSQDSIVDTLILGTADDEPTDVAWRVRSKDGQMKIVDVLVHNISMSVTQRSDFDSVIMKSGGSIEGLLQTLRQYKGS